MDDDARNKLMALRARLGPDEEAQARIDAAKQAATDWKARCKSCGKMVQGSLDDLNRHGESCG